PDPPAPAGRGPAGALRRGGTPARLEITARAPAEERMLVRIGIRVDHHIDAVALRPQVDDARVQARKAVVVLADLARFVAVDGSDEGDFTVPLEHGRVVEPGAARDET